MCVSSSDVHWPSSSLPGFWQKPSWRTLWVCCSRPAAGPAPPLSAAACPAAEGRRGTGYFAELTDCRTSELLLDSVLITVLTCLFLCRWGDSCSVQVSPAGGELSKTHWDSDRERDGVLLLLMCNLITLCSVCVWMRMVSQQWWRTCSCLLLQHHSSHVVTVMKTQTWTQNLKNHYLISDSDTFIFVLTINITYIYT